MADRTTRQLGEKLRLLIVLYAFMVCQRAVVVSHSEEHAWSRGGKVFDTIGIEAIAIGKPMRKNSTSLLARSRPRRHQRSNVPKPLITFKNNQLPILITRNYRFGSW